MVRPLAPGVHNDSRLSDVLLITARASVIFVYREAEPRLSRVVMIGSGIITLMFASAALNAYTNPDQSVCAVYANTTEVRERPDSG